LLSSFICGSLTYEIRCWLSVMFMMCISVVWSTLMMLYVGVCCAWRWTSAMSIQDPISKIHLFEQGSSMHIIFAAQCCGLCRHAMSVRLSVCHVRGFCKNK